MSVSTKEDYETELRSKKCLRAQSVDVAATKFKQQMTQNSHSLDIEPMPAILQISPVSSLKPNSLADSQKSVKYRLSKIISVDDDTYEETYTENAKSEYLYFSIYCNI